ncbi:hypothetical protein CBR_g13024 [Chara braunii]|uniref:Nucleosome assembly protein n=1 Tax=Chara braunii TaxID=69332 RepID=A0A388KTB6_CHABU|nr:hypothetical protein CBR_g13024 [Chara braunii]|eukprot:GBG73305.1 hypothetical protein CBR_g13024 [Chara braunii]
MWWQSYGSGGKDSDDTDPYEVISASEPGLETLPSAVRRRVRALKKLHKNLQDLHEDKLNAIVASMEDFATKGGPIYAKRRQIILGKKGLAFADGSEDISGGKPSWFLTVPRFWLLALKGSSTTVELIRRRDESVLSYLVDIRYKRIMEGFTLDFEFLLNPFFTDRVLSKTFLRQDGELVTGSEESVVHWKEGKNVTVRQTKDEKSGRVVFKPCASKDTLALVCISGGWKAVATVWELWGQRLYA